MERNNDGLTQLGKKTTYRMDYAPEVLETFENKHQENDYWVRFNCPEFTRRFSRRLREYHNERPYKTNGAEVH